MVFRHMLASDHWNVHMTDRMRCMADNPELVSEEQRMFERPDEAFGPVAQHALAAVRGRMALDFFGMDFGLAPDGRAVLFEANATMNFFPFMEDPQFAYVKSCLAPAQAACRAMLMSADSCAAVAQRDVAACA